eukprot:TRINITY_DN279_c0_g1_i1.p1 TRINITY_DN279_c0_g1~~TRINITY_DN279_c0_g1_i1.p1  ORF type:complete len:153 (-),score=43.28 TRINITY_DN279_c0_g1_i1:179-637(-)
MCIRDRYQRRVRGAENKPEMKTRAQANTPAGKKPAGKKPILEFRYHGSLRESMVPFVCYECEKEFEKGTLVCNAVVPEAEAEKAQARGSKVSSCSENKHSTTLCVSCYEVPKAVYVDGKTNLGEDGDLLDRVVETDEFEHAKAVGWTPPEAQ